MKIQNYRGVQQATIVNVKEGDGTHEDPARVTKYVISFDGLDGRYVTVGKIVPLTEEELGWFGNI